MYECYVWPISRQKQNCKANIVIQEIKVIAEGTMFAAQFVKQVSTIHLVI